MSNFDIRNSASAGYKKQLPQLMSNAGINYKPTSQDYAYYQGHPWTKMYDDIVPEADFEKPGMKDLEYYARNFGIDTSVANLKNKFDALTKQEYAQKNLEYQRSEDQYYQNMAAQNAQYQAGAQKAISQALSAGASRGMQFANQFAAQNELAQANSNGALDLATQRNDLKGQEAEAYAQNAINAEQTAYERKANILGQAVADRANEVQRYAADTALYSNEMAQRILNYQYNMSNEFNRFENDKDRELDWYKSLLNPMVNVYTEHLRDYYNRDNTYAQLANQRAIQQMQRQATEEDGYSISQIAEQYHRAIAKGDINTANQLLTDYGALQGYLDGVNADRKALIEKSKTEGPQPYMSIYNNPRWAVNGKTMSQKEYEDKVAPIQRYLSDHIKTKYTDIEPSTWGLNP
jgi:hypothetical protein